MAVKGIFTGTDWHVEPDDPEWTEWLEICEYTGWNPEGPLSPIKYHKHIMPFNPRTHVGVAFYQGLTEMINKIHALRIAIVGPAGMGKTYMGMHIANVIESRRFTVDQIVLSGADYLHLADTLGPKKVIVLDEPTYFASARNWQDRYQKLVMRTLESSRFQNNPIIIPIVNRNLLDKTIREYYLTHVIVMQARGIGRVYRTNKDQWSDTLYRTRGTLIAAFYPGMEIARCGRETCLRCPKLSDCDLYICPQYERKRESEVAKYREEDQEIMKEAKHRSAGEAFQDNVARALEMKADILDDDGAYDTALISYYLGVNRTDSQMIARVLKKLEKDEGQKTPE